MVTWLKYTNRVKHNCTNPHDTQQDLMYWRNNLFASILIYLLPLCLIALIPSLYWIYKTRLFNVAVVDFLTIVSIFFVAFMPHIKIKIRKVIFITTIYILSFALLYFVGFSGSSLIYLLAGTIFSVLIFPFFNEYWPAWLTCFMCIVIGFIINFDLFPKDQLYTAVLGEWIAISMNLIFLSFLFVVLIPRLFNGLQSVINQQIQLQNELLNEKQALNDALKMLSYKNGELEQFSYIASHDLQEPLRMVSSFLTKLKNKYENQLDDKAQQYIHFAVDGAHRMNRIIFDLLEYSRVGKIDEGVEIVDLNKLFENVKMLFAKKIQDTNAEITTSFLPVINTHPTLMAQVFQNLLGNALKYTRSNESPQIFILAEDKNSHWQFSFRDNGIGINEEYFKKIFIIFQRLHHKNEYSGTGLGLAISKKIIDYLGGKIWVESVPGKGSTFYFTVLKSHA